MKDKIALLSKAIEALGDNATQEQKSALKDLEQFVKTAEESTSKIEDLQTQLSQMESEKAIAERDMMKYKSIQKKATEQMTEMEAELDKVKKGYADYDNLKAENESLKQLKVERDNGIKANYEERVKALREKPFFENIKEYISLPTEEKTFNDLDIDEINNSLKELEKFEKAGLLKIESDRSTVETQIAENENPLKAKFNKLWGYDPTKV